MSILYKTTKGWGRIEPSDDVSELKWFDISELDKVNMVNEHKILLEMFIEHMNNEKK
jgi:hypothetical protein